MPGASWPKAIVTAISESQAMVLVFSKSSNDSEHVQREVELAIKRGITVIPLRIEDCVPEGELEFFLSSAHWMDAITPPLERHLQQFGSKVRAILEHPSDPIAALSPSSTSWVAPPGKPASRHRVLLMVGGAALLAVIVAGTWITIRGWGGAKGSSPVAGNEPLTLEPAGSDPLKTAGMTDDPGQDSSIDPQTIAEMDDYSEQRRKGLGEAYLLRRGPIRFRAWLQAADAGYAGAQFTVGMLYWDGIGFSQSKKVAVEWLQRAADQNLPAAMTALGYAYDLGSGGLLVDHDAFAAFTIAAAEGGDVVGMQNLGWSYRYGSGTIAKDWRQAVEWYERAADLGYPAAMLALAQMYKAGNEDLPADPGLAQSWFERAAEAGNPYAQASLFGESFNAAIITYAGTLSAEGESGDRSAAGALSDIESVVERYQGLRFEAQLSIMSDWQIKIALTTIEGAQDGDPVKAILERMTEQLIEQYASSHRVVRQRTLYTFAGATLGTLKRIQEAERWHDIAEFWDSTLRGLSIGYDPPNDIETLVRVLKICTLALYNDGRRDQAAEIVDTVTAMQDEHLRDRPWDWYAKEAYTGFGFEVAKVTALLGDRARSQDLLYRSWSLLFGRYGQAEFVQQHKGALPQRHELPEGMPDEDTAKFVRFMNDETREAFKAKSSVEIPSGSMKKFTIPTDFGGTTAPFDFYVLSGPRGYLELQDQFRWVNEYRGGVVPEDVKASFRKLFDLAMRNDVSFPDLCVYALDAAIAEEGKEDESGSD